MRQFAIPSSAPLLATLCCTLLAACGGGGGGGSPVAPPPGARVSLAAEPSPIVARPCACGPLVGELDFDATLVLSESAGGAAHLEQYQLVLRSDAGAREVSNGTFSAQGNRTIPASSALRYPFSLHFPGADSALPGTLEITATYSDAAAARRDATTSVRVLPPS